MTDGPGGLTDEPGKASVLDDATRIDAGCCRNTVSGAGVFTYRGNLGGLEMRFFEKSYRNASTTHYGATATHPTIGVLGATNWRISLPSKRQCRASVSGVGGFCVPNQFYNPRLSAKRHPQTTREYAPTRCPTILIRGAPNIRKVICKAPDVSAADFTGRLKAMSALGHKRTCAVH